MNICANSLTREQRQLLLAFWHNGRKQWVPLMPGEMIARTGLDDRVVYGLLGNLVKAGLLAKVRLGDIHNRYGYEIGPAARDVVR